MRDVVLYFRTYTNERDHYLTNGPNDVRVVDSRPLHPGDSVTLCKNGRDAIVLVNGLEVVREHVEDLDSRSVGLQLFNYCDSVDVELADEFLHELPMAPQLGWDLGDGANSEVTALVPDMQLQEVPAVDEEFGVAWTRVKEGLQPLSDLENTTVDAVFELLKTQSGGALIVVCHAAVATAIRANALDGGRFWKVFSAFAPNVHDPPFGHLLSAFRQHTASDRWEGPLVRQLACNLGLAADDLPLELQALVRQPKDGAIIMSLHGKVMGATQRLLPSLIDGDSGPACKLIKPDGSEAGTRHGSALDMVQEFGIRWRKSSSVRAPGFVVTCSDAGGFCVMIPNRSGTPDVLHVSSESISMHVTKVEDASSD